MRSQKQYLVAPNIWNVLIYRVFLSWTLVLWWTHDLSDRYVDRMFNTNSKYVKNSVSENMELHAYIITFDNNYLSKSRCARTSFLRAPMVKLIWLHVSTLTFILHFLGGCHLSGFFRYKNGFWGLLTKVEGTLREITAWLIYMKTTSYLQIFCHQKLQCQMIP